MRQRIHNGPEAEKTQRKIQSYYQDEKISQSAMDEIAFGQKSFGLRQMYKGRKQKEIKYGV